MRYLVAVLTILVCTQLDAADKPNILFIAIDDQNDWFGCLGGHPQVIRRSKRPISIDWRLAELSLQMHIANPRCAIHRGPV